MVADDRLEKSNHILAEIKIAKNSTSLLTTARILNSAEDFWEKNAAFGIDQNIYDLAMLHYKVGGFFRTLELLSYIQDKSQFSTIKIDFHSACFELMNLSNEHSAEIAFGMIQNYRNEFEPRDITGMVAEFQEMEIG
jgi:hypothetical protein